jgi:hypothetical protein
VNLVLVVAIAFSIFGLVVGPLLVTFAQKRRGLSAVVEGLTRGAVPSLVITQLVPHLYDEIGAIAPILMAAGFITLWWLERWGTHPGGVGPAIVLPTLAVHSVFDGAALAIVFGEHGSGTANLALVSALVMHRLPEGLFVGATLVPRVGSGGTVKWVSILAASTLAGAVGGQGLVRHLPHACLHGLIAIGLGAMVHLVAHRHGHAHTPSQTMDEIAWGSLAAAVGMAVAFLVPSPGGMLSRAQRFEIPIGRSLGALFLETSPAITAALAVVVGLQWLQPRLSGHVRRGLEILTQDRRAIATSGPIQLASLSVIAPVSTTLSLALLGIPMTAVRLAGCAIAAVAYLVTTRILVPTRGRDDHEMAESRPFRLPGIAFAAERNFRGAPFEFIDRVGPGYVLGLVLAASAEAALPRDALASTPASVSVIGLVSVAAPFGLAPEALLPVLFMLAHKGLGSTGVAAATVAVLMVSFATLSSLWTSFGVSGVGGFVLLAAASSAFAAALSRCLDIGMPSAHALISRPAGLIEWASAVLVSSLLIASLLRIGPAAWSRAAFRVAGSPRNARAIDGNSCPVQAKS